MSFSPTHHAGDPCPADMFLVTPPEAFRSATFRRDVEVLGDEAPYTVRFDGNDGSQGRDDCAIDLDLDPETARTVDGRGLYVVDISATHPICIRMGPQPRLHNHDFRLGA